MVADLSRRGRIEHWLPDLPPELVPSYSQLLEADVPEPLARRLARNAADRLEVESETGCEFDGDDRDRAARVVLLRIVEECLAVAPPIAAVAGSRRVVALVGPTGVGKTTTVAKLAANFKLAPACGSAWSRSIPIESLRSSSCALTPRSSICP